MKRKTYDISRNYNKASSKLDNLYKEPLALFDLWMQEAIADEPYDASAMVVSTVGKDNKPSSRVVLLKEFSEKGFIFFTNYNSRKGKEIIYNSSVALNFYWKNLEKQVRVEGTVVQLAVEKSIQYFNERPLKSRAATIISNQSEEIPSYDYLENKMKALINSDQEMLCPKHWGGYLVVPNYFEFWEGRPNRLNYRLCYVAESGLWNRKYLAP
ncbi:MAG: pyridoxamine 5'-phosphate oxidase [Bacteroidales bacterium]